MNGWKVTAIIFIGLFIIESFFLISVFYIAAGSLNDKEMCKAICIERNAEAFEFDAPSNRCTCYRNGERIHTQTITRDYSERIR